MKKNIFITVLLNIVLVFINYYIILLFSLAAFINDYIEPISKIQQYLIFSTGILLAITLDLLLNLIIIKIINKGKNKLQYGKVISISLIITLFETIYILIA